MQEFYDYNHHLHRLDVYYERSLDGASGSNGIIHDFGTSVQYTVSNNINFCLTQPLSKAVPHLWDVTTDDKSELKLVSPNNVLLRGTEYNYTYQGATNIRGVDVDYWVSYREFEQITDHFNFSNAYYYVYFTRPGWILSNIRSVTSQPVPWRLVINGTVSKRNISDNSIFTYNTTIVTDISEFSTDEPPYDVFDVSACSGPNDYYALGLIIPDREEGLDFGQLRRNIRMCVSNYTGLRPLQIGNIQVRLSNCIIVLLFFIHSPLPLHPSSHTPLHLHSIHSHTYRSSMGMGPTYLLHSTSPI